MHSSITRIFSIFLASWLMITSIGAHISVHLCGGEIYSVGINADADKCAGFHNSDKNNLDEQFGKVPCCEDYTLYFHSDVDSRDEQIAFQSYDALPVVASSEYNNNHYFQGNDPARYFYAPPEYERDLLTLYSVFRI